MSDAPDFEDRLAAVWRTLDAQSAESFISALDVVLAECTPSEAVVAFERGAAQDSTGHPERAVPLYEAALAASLTGLRRRRAVIQMASSIRNLGDSQRACALLSEELAVGHDELETSVRAFLALTLADLGREREALAIALSALARHLPRYNGSLARYADALLEAPADRESPAPGH